MYNKIVNPLTGKKCNIHSKIGKEVLNNYINHFMIGGVSLGETKGVDLSESKCFILAGPSGVGKSTLIKLLNRIFNDKFGFVVSHTTRKPRPGEKDGEDYHYVSEAQFKTMIANNEFLEHAKHYGTYYGTSKQAIMDVNRTGKICVLDIDVVGVQNIKEMDDFDPVYIFIDPPGTLEEALVNLRNRLEARGTENEAKIVKRVNKARSEIEYANTGAFDIRIVNDDIFKSIIELKNFLINQFPELKELERFPRSCSPYTENQ